MQNILSKNAFMTFILSLFFTINAFSAPIDKKLSKQFNDACFYGDVETVKTLVNNESVDINFQDNTGRTGLLNAVMMEQVGVVAVLVKLPKIDLNKKDISGTYPLFYAVFLGNLDLITLLEDAGANE